MKKRMLSLLLTILLLASMIPFNAINVFAASDNLIWPCESAYYVTCMYYYKDGSKHSTRYGYEKGIDITGGGNIVAAEAGTVETATNLGSTSFGKYVVIKHASGYRTLYGHLSSYSVSVGQAVSKGQKIGVMGSTGHSSGTHLHFEYSGGDPWKTYFNSKYASSIVFEQNVRSNNNTYNSDKTIVDVIDNNYYKSGSYYYYSNQKKHTIDTSYGTNFTAYPKAKITAENIFNANHIQISSTAWIGTSDKCTIYEVYTDGCCKVSYPISSGGTQTAYSKISLFNSHTHSYSGYYYDSAHPHNVYQKCSCGEKKYTGEKATVSSCSQCSITVDSKYNTVKGFKAYPCVSSTFEVKKEDLSTRNGEIYTSDFCTINELYTNGWCKVTFPMDTGGTRTAYTSISNFIKTPKTSLTKYTASGYINLYSTSSLSTQIYRIYPGDVCYTIGTSGSATQIFMPMSGSGYYVLGWVLTSDLNATPSTTEKLNSGLTSLSSSSYAKCYTITDGRYNVYTSSSLSTRGYEGTASASAWTGENDEIWVIGVGINSSGTAYAKIKYPIGDERYTAYVPLHSTLVPGSLTGSYRTATAKVSGFSDRPGGTVYYNSYYVESGEKVYLLSQQNGYSQILYPTSNNAWRIAWCTDSIYNSMFKAQTYTVTYNANGGSGAPANQTKTRDVDLKLSSTKPTRTGYTFVGWASSSTATTAQYSAGSIYVNEASITLYAVWRPETYTITYNANGGVNAPGVQTQTYGVAMTVTNEQPQKTYTISFNANGGTVETASYSLDCSFISWNTKQDGTGTAVKSGSSYKPNANTTLYAVYENPILENYPIPYKSGYSFEGWYTDANGGTRVDISIEITANITLYAHWGVERYSIIYYDDGSDNIPEEQIKVHGLPVSISEKIPIKDGHTFKGWTTQAGSTVVEYNSGAAYTKNESAILYAVWEANSATLNGITISSVPLKKIYELGESLDTTGLTLRLNFSDGSTQTAVTGFGISGFDAITAGTKTITVSYGGFTDTFTVTVKEKVIIDENAPQIVIGSKSAHAGDTVQIAISLKNADTLKTVALSDISFDTDCFELVSGEWKIGGSILSNVDIAKKTAVIGFENNTNCNGTLFVLTFKVKEDAEDGTYPISCSITAKRKEATGEQSYSIASVAGSIIVTSTVKGDANGDNEINSDDAIYLLYHTLLPDLYPLNQNGDFDGNGEINSDDAIYLLYYTLLPDLYPLN